MRDEYLKFDFGDSSDGFSTDRREFLKILGGGILVLVALGEGELLAQGRRGGFGQQLPTDFNAFLKIGEDGRVSCFTGKIEMGQGVVTSLAQMLADELNVPLESVDMVMGDTDLCPWDMGTFGSMSTRFFGPALRAAAAEARAVLVQLAEERLQTPAAQLKAENGTVFVKEHPEKKASYAELTKGKRIERQLNQKAVLEAVSEFTIIGKPVLRRDALDKVTGKAKYAADIRLPGMLSAAILRPPAHGAKLNSADTSEAESLPGVRIVKEGDLVAALHEHSDLAEWALSKVKAQFDRPQAEVDDKTIFDHLLKVAPEGRTIVSGGDLKRGAELASSVIEATYLNSYVAHAPIEPHAALAQIEGDKVTVWASTQNPFGARDEIARRLGLDSAKVRVITPFVGGGFGGKTNNQQAVEAAVLAKAIGKPVQVVWSRAEEFFYDTFRPAAVVKIRSGVDGAGRIVLWDYHVYFAGERGAQQFYDVPNHATVTLRRRLDGRARHAPVPDRPLASPGQQHQHLRQGIADRHDGREGGGRSRGVPPEEPDRPADDPRPENGGGEIRMDAEEGPKRPRPRRCLRHRRGYLCGMDRRGRGGQDLRHGPGQARGLRPGDGSGDQSGRGEDPDGRLHHHGIGLCPGRRGPLQGRRGARPQFRELQDPAVLLASRDPDGARRRQGLASPGRRRAGDHRHGRGAGQRGLRCHRRPAVPAPDDPGADYILRRRLDGRGRHAPV